MSVLMQVMLTDRGGGGSCIEVAFYCRPYSGKPSGGRAHQGCLRAGSLLLVFLHPRPWPRPAHVLRTNHYRTCSSRRNCSHLALVTMLRWLLHSDSSAAMVGAVSLGNFLAMMGHCTQPLHHQPRCTTIMGRCLGRLTALTIAP